MKIRIIVAGETRDKAVRDLTAIYAARMPHYIPFEIVTVPDAARRGKTDSMLDRVEPGDFLVLLDERGREMTSREFARFIENKSVTLSRNLVFAIGGPYGFDNDTYERADAMLALSRMTFPHELIRPFFVEQLYRAMTIIRGENYHHD